MSDTRHPGLNLGQTDASAHEAAEEVIFGFWIFLMSDLVVFALLFATHADMSLHGIAGAPGPADVADLRSAFAETLLLLGSSFTFGLASLALKYRQDRRRLVLWLGVTGLLGLAFLGLEVRDALTLLGEKDAAPQRSGYLSSLFLLVGTHWLHVAAGLLWMAVLLVQIAVFGLVERVKHRIMRLALFWHMLDVVWVGIFTFVFLWGSLP